MFVQADLELLLINMMGLLVCGIDVCEWSMEIMITHLKQPFICAFLGIRLLCVLCLDHFDHLKYSEISTFCSHVLTLDLLF
jgi:hypothetical protein